MDFASAAAGIGSIMSGASGIFGGSKGPSLKQLRKQAGVQAEHQKTLDWGRPSWITQGAKEAGIHPLTALGSPVSGGASISLGGGSDRSVGDAMYSMGQGVQGAVNAYRSKEERALATVSQKLSVEHQGLQNDYIRAQIAQISPAGRSSGMSVDPALPDASISSRLFNGGLDGLLSDDFSLSRSTDNRTALVPSESMKQKMEDMILPELNWYARLLSAKNPIGKYINPFTATINDVPEWFQNWFGNDRSKPASWYRKGGK